MRTKTSTRVIIFGVFAGVIAPVIIQSHNRGHWQVGLVCGALAVGGWWLAIWANMQSKKIDG